MTGPLFVVSGGAKGITARCVVDVARAMGGTYVLIGRSEHITQEPAWAHGHVDLAALQNAALDFLRSNAEKPHPAQLRGQANAILSSREIGATLAEIRAVGAVAHYLQANITDRAALAAALDAVLPHNAHITGLIHGAGVLADKHLQDKTPADFDRVYDTKLAGLQNLLEILPTPEQIVLFSSAAAAFGNAGQTDYALANDVLNKAVYRLRHLYPNSRVQAIDWGPWDGGMVTPALKALFASNNVDLIPQEAGAQALLREMRAPRPHPQVVVGAGFDRPPRPLTETLHTHRIERVIDPAANPFLAHHRIDGRRVLPAVHALHWMTQTAAGLYPGYHFVQCADFSVLKGIIVEAPTAYLLTLTETQKREGQIVFGASITAGDVPHYRAVVGLSSAYVAAPVVGAASQPGQQLPIYEDGTLFHGPHFRSIHAVQFAEDAITVACVRPHVDEAAQGQFRIGAFDPFMADAMWQALLLWVHRQHRVLSLPVGFARWRQFGPLHTIDRYFVSVVPTTRHNITTADAVFYDTDGRYLAEVDGVQHVHHENLRFQPYAP